MANVCCSIEMEPRTLNQGQLNHAREMAADVVQKMEPKEASASFMEACSDKTSIKLKGMGMVISGDEIKELMNELTLTDDNQENKIGVDPYLSNQMEKKTQNLVELERPCQCSCEVDSIESPDPVYNFKEPVTAPF